MKTFNNFNKIADSIKPACKIVVKKAAMDIKAQVVSRAPVDTGFLKNSIYTVASDGSTYKGGKDTLPPISKSSSTLEAYVAVAANYGIYVEYGTRFMPSKPYFHPAVEAVRPSFEQALQIIIQKMNGAANG